MNMETFMFLGFGLAIQKTGEAMNILTTTILAANILIVNIVYPLTPLP